MAKAADAATPAPDDDADTGATDTGSETPDAGAQPEVVATILCYSDGSYGLTQGDENEDDAGGEAEGGAEPQRFDSIGALLKGVMEIVKSFEATKGGEGSEAENFASGLSGGASKAAPSPAGGM